VGILLGGCLTCEELVGILLGGCLTCEELVGVTHRRWWGWFRRIQHISSIGGFFNNGGFESESRN